MLRLCVAVETASIAVKIRFCSCSGCFCRQCLLLIAGDTNKSVSMQTGATANNLDIAANRGCCC